MLALNGLSYQQPGSILQEVNLIANVGQIILVSGPSGIGKTTLIDIISGFHQPKTGTVKWYNENLLAKPPWARPVSTMFQTDNFFPHLSVKENLLLGLKKTAKLSNKIQNKLEFLNVSTLLNRKSENLSGGELQRVSLVRALLREKPILLLDEPFSALDTDMVKKASKLILKYTKEMQSVTIVVSHRDVSAYLNANYQIELKQ